MTAVISGQLAVATAGTEVKFSTSLPPGTYLIKPMGANSGSYMYIGNDGADAVSSTSGYQLKKGLDSIVITVNDPSKLYVDSDTNGDKICFCRVMGEGVGIAPPVG